MKHSRTHEDEKENGEGEVVVAASPEVRRKGGNRWPPSLCIYDSWELHCVFE